MKAIRSTAITNDEKIPAGVFFSPPNINDNQLILPTVAMAEAVIGESTMSHLTGDKGYQDNKVALILRKKGIILNIPNKKNLTKLWKRKTSFQQKQLKKRTKGIEHFFSILKRRFKRFAFIRDRSDESLIAWIMLACAILVFENLYESGQIVDNPEE